MNLQNAPFISGVAAFVGAAFVLWLSSVGFVGTVVGAALVAIVAYLVTSWQVGRMRE